MDCLYRVTLQMKRDTKLMMTGNSLMWMTHMTSPFMAPRYQDPEETWRMKVLLLTPISLFGWILWERCYWVEIDTACGCCCCVVVFPFFYVFSYSLFELSRNFLWLVAPALIPCGNIGGDWLEPNWNLVMEAVVEGRIDEGEDRRKEVQELYGFWYIENIVVFFCNTFGGI